MLNGPTGTFFEMGGGGVSIFGDAMVTDCRIEDNVMANNTGLTADNWNGAGIGVYSGAPIISGNLIQRNITTPPNLNGQSKAMGWGAGIFSRVDTRSVITHNVIRQNVALAQDAAGAGVNLDLGQAGTILSNNLIVANSASTNNGGLCLYGNDVAVYNNLVMGNVAGSAGGGMAVSPQVGQVNLTNNTIVGNVLTVHTVPKGAIFSSAGGGVYASFLSASPPPTPLIHLTNNLVAQNDTTSLGGGGGLFIYRSNPSNDHEDYFGDIPNEIRSDVTGYTGGDIFGSNGNISLSPVFVNAPVFWDHTNAAGTATTAVVFDSTRYAVGNRIEYNDDGVARQITVINSSTKTLTFTPALSSGTTAALRILANWGTNTNVTEDLRLTGSSPLRDAGTYAGAPSTDLDDLPRPTDGDVNGSVVTDIGAYEFRFSDSDGDGVVDSSDCAPMISSVWMVPGEVPWLTMAADQTLSWPRISQANVCNLYVGTITSPFTYNPTCLAGEVTGLTASTNVGPPPGVGTGFYYLVGGVNRCGSGALHSNPTVNASPACTAQNLDSDQDSFRDIDDNCPTVYNPTQQDSNHNGIGDVCE